MDARARSPLGTLRDLETALLKGRGGARRVVVRVEVAEVLDAVRDWADDLEVPYTLVAAGEEIEVHLYVLPAEFGEHPLATELRRAHIHGGRRHLTPPSLPPTSADRG